MNDVRLKLKELENNPDGFIEIKDEWHFNDAVYKGQVRAERSISEKINVSDTTRYNHVLSDSVFALCPSGAGPNSIRFWEAIYNGAIPVLIYELELPSLSRLAGVDVSWEELCIFITYKEVKNLEQILSEFSKPQILKMQRTIKICCNNIFTQVKTIPYFFKTTRYSVILSTKI